MKNVEKSGALYMFYCKREGEWHQHMMVKMLCCYTLLNKWSYSLEMTLYTFFNNYQKYVNFIKGDFHYDILIHVLIIVIVELIALTNI